MTEIDVIMGMLDWNNSAEEQAAGLAQAAQVENFQVFFSVVVSVVSTCADSTALGMDSVVAVLRKSSGNAVGCGIRRLFGKPVGMAARHELAGRFSHPRKAAGFSELGGTPSGDRGKSSVRAGAWGRGMGGESQKTAKL